MKDYAHLDLCQSWVTTHHAPGQQSFTALGSDFLEPLKSTSTAPLHVTNSAQVLAQQFQPALLLCARKDLYNLCSEKNYK